MLGKLEDKLVEKCRESESFAWGLTAFGMVLMVVIASL
jgi:hypothetical protein